MRRRGRACWTSCGKATCERGHVTSHRNFGTFVDLGGAEGLIHISELSWRPLTSPDEVLQVGEETEVYVLRVDREAQRISLSLRQLQPGPWQDLVEKHQEGDLVRGTVTRLTPFRGPSPASMGTLRGWCTYRS